MSRALLGLMVAACVVACTSAPIPTPAATADGVLPTPTASGAPASDGASTAPSPPAETSAPATATPAPTMGEPEDELATPGVLTVCLAIVGAPAASIDENGEPVGYNVSIAEAIAERLELAVAFQQPVFEDLLELVENHTCDISVSSQNITASRLERAAFVPYTRSQQPVLVASGNPAAIDALNDLCGLPVSATAGTTHVDLVEGAGEYVGEGLNDACTEAGQATIMLRTFETEAEAVQALLDGDVMAYLGNPSYIFDYPEQLQYSPAVLPSARQGIAVALDHPALQAAVQQALDAMIADGTYRQILASSLPPAADPASVDNISIENE